MISMNASFQKLALLFLFFTVALHSIAQQSDAAVTISKIGNWLDATALKTQKGYVWAAEDGYINTINAALYAGSAGVVLFCLEAYHSSGDKKQLQLATEAADFLANTLPDNLDTTNDESGGLYTGIAGIGFALSETYKIIKEEKYRIAFLQCIRLLQNALTAEGDKIHYGSSTDIISGNAGIGLFWLYAYNETGDDKLKQTAAQTDNWLIAKAIADSAGFA